MNNNMMEELAELLRAEPQYDEAQACFVSLYRKEQQYGGPEEGGWWYDVWTLDGSMRFPTRQAAETYLQAAKAVVEVRNRKEAPARHRAMAALPDIDTGYHDEGYIPLGWSDGGEWHVCVEDRQGSLDNSQDGRPHYE
jgi:hypothetical protein